MNSCACAARAAASTASCGASGSPNAMLSRTDAEKRNGSCEMTPISRRSERRSTSRTSMPSTSTRPAVDVVEPRHERGERRLPGAGPADERDRAARRDLEVDVLEDEPTGLVAEVDALEADLRRARAASGSAPGRVGDLLGLVEHLEDPLARGDRALRLADPHADHAQRHHEHREQEVEGEEAAER